MNSCAHQHQILETMGAATLANLLVDHAKVDPVLRRKLQLLLASSPWSSPRRSATSSSEPSFVQELDHLRDHRRPACVAGPHGGG